MPTVTISNNAGADYSGFDARRLYLTSAPLDSGDNDYFAFYSFNPSAIVASTIFDVTGLAAAKAGALAGKVITSVTLRLITFGSYTAGTDAAYVVSFYKLLVSPNFANATWNNRNATGPVAWDTPGGKGSGTDHAATASGSVGMPNTGTATYDVTLDPQDLQDYIDGVTGLPQWVGYVTAGAADRTGFVTNADPGYYAGSLPSLIVEYGTHYEVDFEAAGELGASFTSRAHAIAAFVAGGGFGAGFAGRAVTHGFISAGIGAGSSDTGQTDGDGVLAAGASLSAVTAAQADARAAINAGLAAGETWAAHAAAAASLAAAGQFGSLFDAETQNAQFGALTAGTVAGASFSAAVETIAALTAGATLSFVMAAIAQTQGTIVAEVRLGATFRAVGGDPDILPPATETLEIEPRIRKLHIDPRVRSIRLH